MKQENFKKDCYDKLSLEGKKELRSWIMSNLMIGSNDLYRRIRLCKFQTAEWKIVEKHLKKCHYPGSK